MTGRIPAGHISRPPVVPFDPVFKMLSSKSLKCKANGALPDGAVANVALRLGVQRRWIYRWWRRGLDHCQADAVATVIGVHPSLIWDDWWDLASVTVKVPSWKTGAAPYVGSGKLMS